MGEGDLDTSQGRGIEPFGPMLGSQIDFGFGRIAIRSLSLFCLVILRVSDVTLQSLQAFMAFKGHSSPSQGLHQIRYSMSSSALETHERRF